MSWQAQVATTTNKFRHENLFSDLRKILVQKNIKFPRILSFGCSVGYEALDISRHIQPARIFACDVNDRALAEAKKNCFGSGIEILKSSKENLSKLDKFDAITVLSVLTNYPEIQDKNDISKIYQFSNFESLLGEIVALLAPGGMLVLYNSCYLFEQTKFAANFEEVASINNRQNGWSDKYSKAGEKLTEVMGAYRGGFYKATEWRQLLRKDSDYHKSNDGDDYDYYFDILPSAAFVPNTTTVFWRLKSNWMQRKLRNVKNTFGYFFAKIT